MKHEEVMGYSCRYYGNNDYGWLMGYYASVDHQCDTIGDIYDIYMIYIYILYICRMGCSCRKELNSYGP